VAIWTGLSAAQHGLLDHDGLPGVGEGGGGGESLDTRMILLIADNIISGDLSLETSRAVALGGYLWAPYCPMANNGTISVQAIATHTTGHFSYCQVAVRKVADENGVPIMGAGDTYYGIYQAPPQDLITCSPMVPAPVDLFYEGGANANYEIHEASPGLHVIKVLSAGVYGINVLPTWQD
jgi:hypothetical protein